MRAENKPPRPSKDFTAVGVRNCEFICAESSYAAERLPRGS
jgi:hypothetical protein